MAVGSGKLSWSPRSRADRPALPSPAAERSAEGKASSRPLVYRAEIDGLRALAVIAVILFHADITGFEGGYIGVDIFFVISGYLITSIILADLEAGRFSLLHFWQRRVRRIFPALFLVMGLCLPFAWIGMLPDPLENFGQSVVATTFFANNVLLTLTSGYWDLASEFKPLLHTWSLAVEEQYYLIFPLLLMGLWPLLGSASSVVIAILAIASLGFFIIGYPTNPDATFYLLHTRAWELLTGALAAYAYLRVAPRPNGKIAGVSLVVILASIVWLGQERVFAHILLVLPVLATALLILYGRGDRGIGVFLAHPWPVGIGLMSYSLYLFHQPLLAFLRINSFEPPSTPMVFAAIVSAFVLAWLSWRFVERPFRDARRISTRMLSISALSAMTIAAAAGGMLYVDQGYPERIFSSEGVGRADLYIDYNMNVHGLRATTFPRGEGPAVLVLGNSQARDFVNMLRETGELAHSRLVYRDDLSLCRPSIERSEAQALLAEADLVIMTIERVGQACIDRLAKVGVFAERRVLFVGPKQFGYNLNRFIHVPPDQRADARAKVLAGVVEANLSAKSLVPEGYYLDILGNLSADGTTIPVFDDAGNILSADRVHLTRQGARFIGERVFRDPVWRAMVKRWI